MSDIKDRVLKFKMLELPGQPQMMHMGTSYLVGDLALRINELEAQLAEAQKNAAITEYYADGPRGVRRVADLEATNLRHRLFSGFDGCTDGGCVISDNRKGMHTNGGCNCFLNMSRSQLNIVQSRLQAILYSAARRE